MSPIALHVELRYHGFIHLEVKLLGESLGTNTKRTNPLKLIELEQGPHNYSTVMLQHNPTLIVNITLSWPGMLADKVHCIWLARKLCSLIHTSSYILKSIHLFLLVHAELTRPHVHEQ